MHIFKYSFKKILFSPSNWILLIISIIILTGTWFGISILMPPPYSPTQFLNSTYTTWLMLSFIIFVNLILFIIIAIKGTQVFRDDLDDGTLLILVSKPVTRSSIFLQKILAFQTVMMLFLIIIPLISSLPLLALGNQNAFIALIPKIGMLIGFIFLFQLIFSSIVILLSLVTSAKTLVCLVLVFGTLLSITSMISTMMPATPTDTEYSQDSKNIEMYKYYHDNLSEQDFQLITDLIKNNASYEISKWSDAIVKFYHNGLHISTTTTDPKKIDVNMTLEQKELKLLAKDSITYRITHPLITADDAKIDTSLYHILELSRIKANSSYFGIIGTRNDPFITPLSKFAVSINNLVTKGISQDEYNNLMSSLKKQRIIKYGFSPFMYN